MKSQIHFPKVSDSWFFNAGDFHEVFIAGVVGTMRLHRDKRFDITGLTRLVLGSMELAVSEKNHVLEELSTLSLEQHHLMAVVFRDEVRHFERLDEHEAIAALSAGAIVGAFALAVYRGAGYASAVEEETALHGMAERKLATNRLTRKRLDALEQKSALVSYAYGQTTQVRRRHDAQNDATHMICGKPGSIDGSEAILEI